MTAIRQTTVRVTHCVTVDDSHPLRTAELARAVGHREEWVLELVEAGLIAPTAPEAPRAQWAGARRSREDDLVDRLQLKQERRAHPAQSRSS